MTKKPTYEELEQRVKELEKEALGLRKVERDLRIFKTAVETSINAIGITDLEGKLIYINDSCVKMWGYNNKDDMLGKFLPEFWEGDGVLKTIKELREKSVASGEDVGKRKDSSLFPVQFTASMFKDEAGNPSFMFGSFFDITERKQAEEALRQSEMRLDKINECFLSFGTDANENIKRLTTLCGELLGATCSLYNRLDGDMLYSWGQWNTPDDYNPVDTPEGHICYDVIKSAGDETLVINNLTDTHYAKTDPNVIQYKLQTYVGRAVKLRDEYVGSLCAVFQVNIIPDEADKKAIEIIASAIGIEEERKRAEEALRESETKYRHLFEMEFDGIFLIRNSDGQILEVNTAGVNLYGFSREELLKMKNTDLSAEPDETRKAILKRKREVPTRYHKKKDGTVFPVEITGNHFTWRGEEVHIASIRDIAKRKQAEDALRESEEKYSNLFHFSNDGIFLHDLEGNIIDVNQKALDQLRYTKSEMLPFKIPDFHPPEALEKSQWAFETIIQEGFVSFETDFKKKTGEVFPAEVSSSLFEIGDKKVIQGIVRDITDRKLAEEAVRESEIKFRSLFNLSPQAIGLTEIEQGKLVDVNDKFCELTQYTKEEIIGFTTTELGFYTEEDRSRFITELKRYGEVNGMEMDFMVKDGSILNTLMFARIIQIAGEPFILTIIFDLTEQKRLQAQLQQAQKMETVGLLAGGVAHDLNNILSGIVSYPELLLLDLPEDSKLRKPIETMQESGHRAVAIVQDLLTVARGVAITKEPLNLNDLVSDYLNSPEFKKLKQFHPTVTIKINLDSNLLNITGSHVHIRKVIMNLVSNASEAIEGSGNVIISTMNRYIDRPLKGYDDITIGEYAVLAVSDDGSGILSNDIERIFDPFYTKKVLGRSGTGLGLAVVWNVLQDHEGYIDVKSDENGTIFELYFSITRDEISDKNLSIPIKDYKGNGETVLVVDDVESQQEISCKMLDTLGYKTQAVSSGEEAVEYLKENTVDLIMLDMIMDPGINGRETFERIIKIHPKQKAIIVSGFAETDDVKETQKLGAGQYIKKPLTLEMIGIAVKDELKK